MHIYSFFSFFFILFSFLFLKLLFSSILVDSLKSTTLVMLSVLGSINRYSTRQSLYNDIQLKHIRYKKKQKEPSDVSVRLVCSLSEIDPLKYTTFIYYYYYYLFFFK